MFPELWEVAGQRAWKGKGCRFHEYQEVKGKEGNSIQKAEMGQTTKQKGPFLLDIDCGHLSNLLFEISEIMPFLFQI